MKGSIICAKCSKAMAGEQCAYCGSVRAKIVVYFDGKHHKVSRDKDDDQIGYRKASRMLEAIRNAIDEKTFDPSDWQPEKLKKKRFEELAWAWLAVKEADVERGRFAQATFASYQSTVKAHLLPFFGAYDIRDIKRPVLKDYFNDYLQTKGIVKQSSKQAHQIILHSFLAWVRDDREILKSLPPFPEIEGEESEPRKALEITEQDTALVDIPLPWKDMILFGMETGLRPAENCALKVMDFDRINCEATIRRTFSRDRIHEKTKQKRTDTIPLTDTAMGIVVAYSAGKLPTAFLFDLDGKPIMPSMLAYRWKKFSGSLLTIYEASRHSFASQLDDAGVDIRDIQKLMRHKSVATTERYIHQLRRGRQNLRATVTHIRTRPGTEQVRIGNGEEREGYNK
jgi:integrase